MSRRWGIALTALLGASSLIGCSYWIAEGTTDSWYRDAMREFVLAISEYASEWSPGFLIVPQNGEELLTMGGSPDASLAPEYAAAVDGFGREDLFYGYENDNRATPLGAQLRMIAYLDRAEGLGIEVLVADYCWTPSFVDASYAKNEARGYASFAAPSRELDLIPASPPQHRSDVGIASLSDVRNFLYLINPSRFETKVMFLDVLAATDYDLLIIDLDFDAAPLTAANVARLQAKAHGEARLVLCYLSIGEAENYRSYWEPAWGESPPAWLGKENPDWPGNYAVEYWDPEWQTIVLTVVNRVLAAGFDGVYLDRIDAYESFED